MVWSADTLEGASKKELVQFLQAYATAEHLQKYKLKGQEKAIVKKAKLPALHAAYTEAMDQPKQNLTPEGYDYVRAEVCHGVAMPAPNSRFGAHPPLRSNLHSGQVFGNGGEALDEDDLRLALGAEVERETTSAADAGAAFASAADAIAARLAKLGLHPIEAATGGAGQNYDGPYLDEMPSDVLVRIMQWIGLDATERVCFASASPKIRNAVRRAGPVAWRELELVHNPAAAAKLTTQGLKTLATISDGELRRLDVTGCFSLSRASIMHVAKTNKHLEEILVRFETSWAPEHTSSFAKSLLDLCPMLKYLRCDITAPIPTPELLQVRI